MHLPKAIFAVLMVLATLQLSALELSSLDDAGIQACSMIENESGVAVVNVNNLGIPFFISPNAEDDTLVLEAKTRVGIGTASPDSSLHIQRSDGSAGLHIEEQADFGTYILAHLETANARPRFTMTHGGIPTTWNYDILNVTGNLAILRGGGGPAFIFDATTGDFSIDGNFVSGGLVLNVPDYVFADDYELRPLEDVRAFIQAESHLPEIPSASEIRSEGLDITDMQLKLLQKVEELTLYTLEQHDTIAEQRRTIEALQASVEALQRDVAAMRSNVQ